LDLSQELLYTGRPASHWLQNITLLVFTSDIPPHPYKFIIIINDIVKVSFPTFMYGPSGITSMAMGKRRFNDCVLIATSFVKIEKTLVSIAKTFSFLSYPEQTSTIRVTGARGVSRCFRSIGSIPRTFVDGPSGITLVAMDICHEVLVSMSLTEIRCPHVPIPRPICAG
jgi:hypothetical protein